MKTKIHELKLSQFFAKDVLSGRKCFEVRLNDRGYQAGDHVRFFVVNKEGVRLYHKLDDEEFIITYILSGWGITPDYVVFGIKKITDNGNFIDDFCKKIANAQLEEIESGKGLQPIGPRHNRNYRGNERDIYER